MRVGLLGLLLLTACTTATSSPSAVETSFVPDDTLPIRIREIMAGTFEQAVDHPTDGVPSTAGTFAQRYWYSTEYASGDDAPVLFYIGGEYALNAGYMQNHVGDVARSLGAAVVMLEHRFYGMSQPAHAIDNVRYFTVHNALEDLASFERFARADLPLHGKWVAVGRSYPGFLAAAYRLMHPELVVGAWASSAPMTFTEGYEDWDAIVVDALGPACAALAQKALADAGTAYDDPAQREELQSRLFAATRDQAVATTSRILTTGVMYGATHATCSALAQHADRPLDAVFQLAVRPELPGIRGSGPFPESETEAQENDVLTSTAEGALVWTQAWSWQQCSELGLHTVRNQDRARSVMPDTFTVDTFRAGCAREWGTQGPPAVGATSAYGRAIHAGKATNIFFTNGTLDPWSRTSFLDAKELPPGITLFVLASGSHAEDLNNLRPDSPPMVFDAHATFGALARTWLD